MAADQGPDATSEPRGGVSDQLLTAITTEHFVLQTARGVISSEATSRTTIYLGVLSSVLIAVGFLAETDSALVAFLAAVLPVLLVLGTFTFVRLVQIGAEDVTHLSAMQRIRRGYLTVDADAQLFFPDLPAPAAGADLASVVTTSGGGAGQDAMTYQALRGGETQLLFTAAFTVGVVNSMLAGIAVVLLMSGLGVVFGIAVAVGIAAAALSIVGHLLYERRHYRSR